MVDEAPKQVIEAGLDGWYSALGSQDRVRVRRYLDGIDTSSTLAFLTDLMARAVDDHNYKLSVTAGMYLEEMELDDYGRFVATEGLIEGMFGSDMFEDAKRMCVRNLELFPMVKADIEAANGGVLPQKISCRNRLIDILVGVDGNYDDAYRILDNYCEQGLIDIEERDYRKQSLKIHRMQRSFDNIFNFKKAE